MNRIAAVFIALLMVSAAMVSGGTYALFTDTETSTGNTFTAGCWSDGGCDCDKDCSCDEGGCDCDKDCNNGGCGSECNEDEDHLCEEGQEEEGNSCEDSSDEGIEEENNETNTSPVSITSPSNGAEVCGTVNITANVGSDPATHRNIMCVVFYIDGEEVGRLEGDGSSSTYIYYWDTTKTNGGRHTLMVEAHYTAGTEVSEQVVVLVNNSIINDSLNIDGSSDDN